MKVFITGIGVNSALGTNVEENFSALSNQQSGITEMYVTDLNKNYYAGVIKKSNTELAFLSGYSDPKVSRTALLGMLAAKECWGENSNQSAIKTGVISGTSVGGMDVSEVLYRNKLKGLACDINDVKNHDTGRTTELIASHLGLENIYINTISTACSSGANAIMQGARMIKNGKLDRVLVGGVDALTSFTISGFNSLMIYSDKLCVPFDENREGLNLGEGAGFLLLESENSQRITGNKILGVVSGWSNTADAYHQTATSPDAKGATKAMSEALEKASLVPSQIGYVNAHGTGTNNNDLTESIAISTVFGSETPPFSSTKSFTGHTLAASGAIEAVYSILSFQNEVLFANLRFKNAIPETRLIPLKHTKEETVEHIMSNSFGFGGNCTSLILSKK